MTEKSIGKNAVLNTMRTLMTVVFPLVTFPYVSRVLQPYELGRYNFAASVVSYFSLIAALGISAYAIREGIAFRKDRAKFNEFANDIFSINIYATIFAYLLLLSYIFFSTKAQGYTVLLLIISAGMILTTIGINWVYNIFEEYGIITLVSFIFQAVSMILLFIFVKGPEDINIYVSIIILANMGPNIIYWFYGKKFCDIRFKLKPDFKNHIKPILILFSLNIAVTIYVSADTTMLGYMTGDYSVGIYSAASNIYKVVKQLLNAVVVVVIPRAALYAGTGDISGYKNLIAKMNDALFILCLPALTGLFCLSEEIILLMSGESYIEADTSLKLLSIALLFAVFGNMFANCILIPMKKDMIVLVSTVISAAVNIIFNFFLIPEYKQDAAAFTTVLAEFTVMLICFVYARKLIKIQFDLRNIVTVITGCIGIIGICLAVKEYISNIFIRTVSGIIISVLVYGIILIITKNKSVWNYLHKIKDKLSA